MDIRIKSPEVLVPVRRGADHGLVIYPGHVTITNRLRLHTHTHTHCEHTHGVFLLAMMVSMCFGDTNQVVPQADSVVFCFLLSTFSFAALLRE